MRLCVCFFFFNFFISHLAYHRSNPNLELFIMARKEKRKKKVEQISLFENLHIGEGNGGRKGDKEIGKKEEKKLKNHFDIYILTEPSRNLHTLSLHGKWQYTHTNKL